MASRPNDGVNAFTWDARNELTSMSGGVAASFVYDPFGRRSSKTVSSTTRYFLYDGVNIAQEQDGSGPTANLLNGLGVDETLVRSDSAGTVSLLSDALASVIALTNGSGSIVTQYEYGPFGDVSVTGNSSSNPSQFSGRENDGTGLIFMRARYYSPVLQRFISEDPSGLAGGINASAYAGNNPATFVDPFGLKEQNQRDPTSRPPNQLDIAYEHLSKRRGETVLDRVGQRSEQDTRRVLSGTALVGGGVATVAVLGAAAVAAPEAYLVASVAADAAVPGTTLFVTTHAPEVIQGLANTPPSNFEQWAVGYVKAVAETGSLWGNLFYRP